VGRVNDLNNGAPPVHLHPTEETLMNSFRLVSSLVVVTVIAGAVSAAATGKREVPTSAALAPSSASKKVINVGIDIPFHPIFDYVAAKSSTYFRGKPYTVKFKFLDATTQTPSFGKGDLDVMTTPPSFIPRVMQQYHLRVAEFFPLARWTIGPQILVPVDSPYKTLQSLRGKNVSIQPLTTRFGSEEAAIMAATGENIRAYFDLKETDAAAQELSLGRVDAAFIEAPTTYPLLQSGKFKAIYSVHDAFLKAFHDPAVVNGGYIARKSFIKTNRRFVNDLIAATQNAWNKYQKDPDAVNKVASQQSGIPAEQLKVVGQVLDLEKMPKALRAITPRDVKTWQKIFPLLKKSGFIKQVPKNIPSLFVITKSKAK
jgi:ABC-type nitrate/sulfonate/bicarbonate transport system substrate-binding protein